MGEAEVLALWEAAAERASPARAVLLATAAAGETAAVADLSIGRRDALLLAQREACFGPSYPCVVDCPACGAELELELESADVRVDGSDDQSATVMIDGAAVEVRAPTTRDVMAVARHPNARRRLIERCVISAPPYFDEAACLEDSVLDAISAALARLDPQAAVTVDLECAMCDHRWNAPFDIGGFLWTELKAQAARVLRDVHALATVYGWSEADVLAVSPARRRVYLEMAAS